MIKTDHHNWYVIVFAYEMPYFITHYELVFMCLQGIYDLDFLYANLILIPKSYILHFIDYDIGVS